MTVAAHGFIIMLLETFFQTGDIVLVQQQHYAIILIAQTQGIRYLL